MKTIIVIHLTISLFWSFDRLLAQSTEKVEYEINELMIVDDFIAHLDSLLKVDPSYEFDKLIGKYFVVSISEGLENDQLIVFTELLKSPPFNSEKIIGFIGMGKFVYIICGDFPEKLYSKRNEKTKFTTHPCHSEDEIPFIYDPPRWAYFFDLSNYSFSHF